MVSSCETVRDVFEDVQKGFQHHGKLIQSLKKIQDEYSSRESFVDKFISLLRHAMIVFKREPAVERIIDFVAKYSTSNFHYSLQAPKDGNLSDEEDYGSDNPFLEDIIAFLLDCHDAKDKAVRFRCCQLIHKLLSNMDDEASIDDNMADAILKHMLERLIDKIPAVRVQAVYALSRLQDPTDDDCPVMSSYLKMMACDSSADVRKAVLLNIALTRKTLREIIARTHDISESVRKIPYRILAEKVQIKSLSIALRVQLLHDGLNDRSESIKDVCGKMLLQEWLEYFKGNIIDLLKSLDVEGSAETAEKAIKVILKGMSKDELLDQIKTLQSDPQLPVSIPYESLDCESAFYWRCLGQHLKSLESNQQDLLELLLPEVSRFCQYLQGYNDLSFTTVPESIDGEMMQKTFIAQQLLMLLGVVDLSDEVGRKRLGQLVHDILVSPYTPEQLVKLVLVRQSDLQPDEKTRIQELVEVIADVRQPIAMNDSNLIKEEMRQNELKLASIKVTLMQLNDDLEASVTAQDFAKAAEIKQQILEQEMERNNLNSSSASISMAVREEKDDPLTLLKCLTIASEMLESVTKIGLNPTLMTLVDSLILPGIQNEDPLVRNVGIRCLGLCAMLSCDFAKKNFLLFLQVAQVDLEIVRLTALQAIFDFLLMFGLEAFKITPETQSDSQDEAEEDVENQETDEDSATITTDTTALNNVLNILTGLLESESNEIRNLAAEGLAKLLLSGRILSAKLLSRLVLLWYNPTTKEDGNLRHCIGVFLPVFAFESRTNQELIEEAFLPILKTLFSAPSSSPLASINCNNVAELLIELSNSRHLKNQSATAEGCSHVALAMKIANEILSDPETPGTRVLCKVLTQLDLDNCHQTSVAELKVLAHQLFENVEDKVCRKLIDKFQKTLEEMDTTKPDENDEANETTSIGNTTPSTIDNENIAASNGDQTMNDNEDAFGLLTETNCSNTNEQLETQSKEKQLPEKTTKSKSTRKKKSASRAYELAARTASVSTSKKTRQKRNAKSISSIASHLNFSDSDKSDKENACLE